MSDPAIFGQAFLEAFRQVIREEIQAANGKPTSQELLTAKELASKLKVPMSWVYEQSRHGGIPSCKLGRYIRFDLNDVLASRGAKKVFERADKKMK
jgi:excisionase family DNA binding protein